MQIKEIPTPEIYQSSADFRFFINWFSEALSKLKYDTDNILDLLDPERCPKDLLWMLCDTYGFKYDDRLNSAFNRLVLLYFMSMIYNRGSQTGMMLAAEVNLAQLNLNAYEQENPALSDRLEDTSIPVNSAYVTPHVDAGYIDVVYFSEQKPVDACIEYVRPLGMYCFQNAGVRADARTKVSVDARLTNTKNMEMSIGPTHVGHYRRRDYASLQQLVDEQGREHITPRDPVFYRNSKYEQNPDPDINPGLRTLFSLQIANNDHIVKALIPETSKIIDPIFSLGKGPTDVSVRYPDNYLTIDDKPEYNLRYDRALEESLTPDVYTVDANRTTDIMNPRPAVNPPMMTIGDAISLNDTNTEYAITDNSGVPHVEPK